MNQQMTKRQDRQRQRARQRIRRTNGIEIQKIEKYGIQNNHLPAHHHLTAHNHLSAHNHLTPSAPVSVSNLTNQTGSTDKTVPSEPPTPPALSLPGRILTQADICRFSEHLLAEEKSAATQGKYIRDVQTFCAFANGQPVTKELAVAYKKECIERGYATRSVNSMIASINSLFGFLGWTECRVKAIRLQHQTYCTEENELSKAEYLRLLKAAQSNRRLHLILQTICGTGIRVSELRYFTVEAVRRGTVTVSCKSKTRAVFLPGKLRKALLSFAKRQKIRSGAIFLGSSGKPLDRSCIWRQMKALCRAASVTPTKVFPHNLRKLFARTFYGIEKDIAKLADILGHSSINTTRIYIMTTGTEHRRKIEQLGLVV